MKKLFMAVAAALISAAGFAQSGPWSVGLNLGYGSEVENVFLGAKVQYSITDDFDVAGSFNHYFKKYDIKYWEINADVHWNLLKGDSYKLYPLVGLTYLHSKFESWKDGSFGANIGVGGQYDFNETWSAGLELKAQIMDATQFVPMASVMYKF